MFRIIDRIVKMALKDSRVVKNNLEETMTKTIALAMSLVFFLMVMILSAVEKEVIQKASELYDQKEYTEALKATEKGIDEFGLTDGLIHTKYKILLALERYEEALETFETIIERVGDSPNVVIDKIRLLFNLKRFDEALDTAMAVEEKSEKKSPYIALFIAKIYIALNEEEKALAWLEKSVERGFDSYSYLLEEEFKILHEDTRFKDLISKIKANMGLGNPAKDFTAPLFSGENYTLSQDKGKVVLIDFWATWCAPCLAEMPHLKKLYKELHQKGFEIVGISLDSNKQVLEKFMKKKEVPWKIAFSGRGRADETAKLYGVDAPPGYFLVGRKGILRFSFVKGGKELEKAIRELVSES